MTTEGAEVQPLRVLQIMGNGIVGGMEVYVKRLLTALPPERFRTTCLCPFDSRFATDLREQGFAVHIAPIPDEPGWRSMLYANALIEAEGIEVIQSHLANAHILAGMLSKMSNIPVLATVHGQDVTMPDLEIHRMADTHLYVVSQAAYYQALTAGVPRSKLDFIPNGVDGEVFKPRSTTAVQDLLGLPPTTPLVGFVGRLSAEKGPDVFVRAAISAHKRVPDVHFVMLGDGPMRSQLASAIGASDMTSHIHLAGVQPHMESLYGSLSAVVSSSYAEGMPLALMEAQSCGIPVIASHVGGIPDIVVQDVTGTLVQAGKSEDFADAIVALMNNPERRTAWAKAARDRMQQHFRWQDRVSQIGQLLTQLARTSANDAGVPKLASVRSGKEEARTRAPSAVKSV